MAVAVRTDQAVPAAAMSASSAVHEPLVLVSAHPLEPGLGCRSSSTDTSELGVGHSMDGASTTFFTKPELTAERREFYRSPRRQGRGTALGGARRDHSARAAAGDGSRALALRRSAAAAHGSRSSADREGSGAPGPRPREPGSARQVARHRQPLHRAAADPAGRDRSLSSSCDVGAAFRARRDRRLHRRRRRTHDDAPGRFHPDAVVDVSRPRQSERRPDGLAGRSRHPDRQPVRHELRRALPGRGSAEHDRVR